jgi:hypothetical protein
MKFQHICAWPSPDLLHQKLRVDHTSPLHFLLKPASQNYKKALSC